MAKVTYDVSDVEDIQDGTHAPVGLYRAKIRSMEPKKSKGGNDMIECVFDLTHGPDGKKIKPNEYMPIWYYPIVDHDHPFVQGRWKEFIKALGLKPKGTLDTNKHTGDSLMLKLKSDTDQDGDYRPKVAKVMVYTPNGDEPEDEPEQDEEPEAEAEAESIDLDALDRAELKKLIKDEQLGSLADLGITKATTDAQIRAIIVAAFEDGAEEEPEDEAEDEDEAEEEDDGYGAMSNDELKAELKSRELPVGGAMAVKIARLRKDDQEEPF